MYRVSFYRKDEVIDGRALRHVADFEATTIKQARAHFESQPNVVVRSVYKTPSTPIRQESSYIFESAESRNKWYNSHSTPPVERLCHSCGKNSLPRYQRFCFECKSKQAQKICKGCGAVITSRRYCVPCAALRNQQKEKANREKKSRKRVLGRIETQIAWAESVLIATQREQCFVAHRYQGARVPHKNAKSRCRFCLQKFIDVQTGVLKKLKGEESDAN